MRQFLFSLVILFSTAQAFAQNCINYELNFTSNVPAGGTTCIVWNAYIGNTFYTNGVAQFSNDVTTYSTTVCLPDTCNIHFICDPCQWPAPGTFNAQVSANGSPLVLSNFSDANGLYSFDVCYQAPCPNYIVAIPLGNNQMNLILDGAGNAQVTWYFNNTIIGVGNNIVYYFPVPGVFTVVAVVTTAGCPQPYEVPVQIIVPVAGTLPCPEVINVTQVSCNTYTFVLENASSGQVIWDFGDGVLMDGVTSVTHTFETNGVHTVAAIYTPGPDNLCFMQYVMTTTVEVGCNEPCTASFEVVEQTCDGHVVLHSLINGNSSDLNWSIDGVAVNYGSYLTADLGIGTHHICVYGQSLDCNTPVEHCENIVITGCDTVPDCSAAFETIQTNTPGVFEFINASTYTGDATFVWNYGNGAVSDGVNGYQAYASNGTYEVCLQLTTAAGCTAMTCVPALVTNMNQGCEANLITITIEGSYASANVEDVLSLILSNDGIEFQVVEVVIGDFLSSYTFEVCLPDGCYSIACISQTQMYAQYVSFMAVQNGFENSTVLAQEILPNDIQQVAMDFGLNTNCETAVEEIQQEALRIYPIPADNELTFQLANAKTANLQLLDLTGRVVLAERMDASGQLKLDISHLPKGIYLAKVQTGKEVLTRKVEVN